MLSKNLLVILCLMNFNLALPAIANESKLVTIENEVQKIGNNQGKIDFLLSQKIMVSKLLDNEKTRYWYLLGKAYVDNQNLDAAINALSRSIELATINFPSNPPDMQAQLVQSLIERSYSKYLQTYNTALYCDDRKKALSYAENILDIDLKVRALVQYSFCFSKKKNKFSYALNLLDQALEIAKENQLSANTLGMIYNALGHLFGDNQLNRKSYQYLLSAFQQWAQVNDYQDMFNMLHSLNSKAISNLRFDLAQQHVDEMFALAKQQLDFNDFNFFSYYNAALLAENTKDFTFSISQYQKALTLQNTTQENYFIRASYESLAIIYLRTNQLALAKETFKAYQLKYPKAQYIKQEMLALEAKVQGNTLASERVLFSIIDEQIKQRREFTHFAVQATASLHNEKINELDIRVLEQELNISQLKLANTLQDKKSMQSTLLFTALFIVSLLLFIGYLLKLHLKVKRYARTDGLTGIANRRFILELGQRMLRKVNTTKPLTILLFDIDNFKQINDGQGHHVGDNAIKLIVNTTSSNLRKQDRLGRIGGDEFLALLPETTKEEAHIIAERIRKEVEQATQNYFENLSAQVSVSIGVVSADHDEQLQAMIIRADSALYCAKGLGRNVVVTG